MLKTTMRISAFAMFVWLLMSSQVMAQSASTSLKSELDKLQSYSADFVQTIEDAEGQILQQSEGSMLLNKPNQLRWKVNSPDESLFVADGQTIYNVDPFVEQVTMLTQESLVANNPLMLLISDDERAWDDLKISSDNTRYIVRSSDENANIVELHLMFVDGKLSELHSKDRQEQVNKIRLSNIQQNIALPAGAFIVDIPETYIVDDQR